MQPRVRLTLMAASLLLLVGLLIAVVLYEPSANEGNSFRGALSAPGQPAAAFTLRDQNGVSVDASSMRGKPVVLTFLYTTCQDTCPVTAQQIRGALDQLDTRVPAVAIAVDPPRDTPLRARRFLQRQGLTGRMSFLLGRRDELQPVWRAFGVRPQEDGLEHSARVVLLDKSGRPAVAWPTDQLTPEGLAHDLRLLLAQSSGS
jgi:protein SCO1/2